MRKSTVLNLDKVGNGKFIYQAEPILEGNRKNESIKGFLDEKYSFLFVEYKGLPAILKSDNYNEYRVMILFYGRIHHQLFGKDFESGKCIYGIFSKPWHKKTRTAELDLFESEINFEDLYHFDYHNGKYVPEFSTKQNWAQAYDAASPENINRAIDYAVSQPITPELQIELDLMKEKGLIVG